MQLDLDFDDVAERKPKRKGTKQSSGHKEPAAAVVATGVAGQGRKSSRLEKRFDKLWRQLEYRQQRNDSFESDFNKARDWIQGELAQHRELYKKELLIQTNKLISHFPKKSLAKWQRQEVGSWIEENLDLLDIHGAPELDDIVKKYDEARMAALSEEDRQFVEEMLSGDTLIDELLAEFDDDDDFDDDEYIDDDFESDFSDSDFSDSGSYQQSAREESAYEQKRMDEQKKKKLTFDKSIVNKLFRRTAKALHPDHEQDPVRRDEKQSLMKSLLEARKSGDIAQIFKMYREHVDSSTIEIDLPELQPMIDLLTQQIAELDQTYYQLSCQTPMHDWVSSHFSGKSEKSKQAALGQLKKDLEQDIRRTKSLLPYLASLAKLKPVLEQRYERHMFSYFS